MPLVPPLLLLASYIVVRETYLADGDMLAEVLGVFIELIICAYVGVNIHRLYLNKPQALSGVS